MTMGPTLHYSHANVHRCYFLAVFFYLFTSLFFSKLMTGNAFSMSLTGPWYLEKLILSPLNIFEYPTQIFVIGLIVGVLIAAPILAAQLMSFKYSILFLMIVITVAKLPGLGVFLIISCIAVASRPLRFRSRFISVVSSLAPVLLYFGIFGRTNDPETLRWALSFTPWLNAFLTAVLICAVVLGIGHFTRYRPGLIWTSTAIMLLISVSIFQFMINLSELDYQLYVANNNPEMIPQFQSHSISEALDKTITNRNTRQYFQPPFYPSEPIQLRATLKREIQHRLAQGRWPQWFQLKENLKFQEKKLQLLKQYELFLNPPKQWFKPTFLHNAMLNNTARIKRIPITLYYKALLSELTPDLNLIEQKETLNFYTDYPYKENMSIWHKLYTDYPDSPESIEARYRRIIHLIGVEKFDFARKLIDESINLIDAHNQGWDRFSIQPDEKLFTTPAKTAITNFEFERTKRKLLYLRELISNENLSEARKDSAILSQYILLNKHDRYYEAHLNELLGKCSKNSNLIDNIMLAKIMLIPDTILRSEKLGQFSKDYKDSDAAIRAKFEQAWLKVTIWKEHSLSESEKTKYLSEARTEFEEFIASYPDSLLANEAAEKLKSLPIR